MSQANLEAMARGIEAWNRGDVDAYMEIVDALIDPELEWHAVIAELVEGQTAVYRGHAGMRRFWDDFHDVWDFQFDAIDFRDLGDALVILAQTSVTGRASGVELETPLGMVARFADGRLIRLDSYLDHGETLAAAGLSH
jgi:ketosteroid isomerase-like protein